MTAASTSSQRGATPRPVRAAGPSLGSHVPAAPRRVSGPVSRPHDRPLARPHGRPPSRPSTRSGQAPQRGLAARVVSGAIALVRSAPDHRWLDRLVRGRAWIPVLGVMLAGIVATQVEVLKLGASTGRWMDRTAALTSRNQALEASVAALSDDQRIERLAAQMGMVVPAPWALSFLPGEPRGGMRAALGRIHAPDSAGFLNALAASQALLSAESSAPTPPPTTSTVTPSASGTPSTSTALGPAAAPQPTVTATGGAAAPVAGTSQQTTGG